MPSLKQLVDAVQAFMDENPNDLITVVVDATFGHRIDPREVAEFDAAIEHNEIVAPPAGAVGRGDAFVLAIAHKVNATIISNDSYQEFHAEYPWVFDDGRLIGGKPVPHVGWVFVPRVPVRGPLSRKVTRDAKRHDRPSAPAKATREASRPMPVPAAPPPGARLASKRRRGTERSAAAVATGDTAPEAVVATPARASAVSTSASSSKSTHVPTPAKSAMVNALLPFISFVEHHPVGSTVDAVVESYASHGAYVAVGDARGYVPLRLMADPAPRSAREVMKLGDTVTLHVAAFHPQRRGIDLSTPAMVGAIEVAAPEESAARPARKRSAKAAPSIDVPATAEAAPPAPKRGRKQATAPVPEAVIGAVETPAAAPRRRKSAAASVVEVAPILERAARRVTTATSAAPRVASKAAAPKAAPKTITAAPVPPPAKRSARPAAVASVPAPSRRKAAATRPSPVPAATAVPAAKAAAAPTRAKKAPSPPAARAKPATPAKAPSARKAPTAPKAAKATPAIEATRPAKRSSAGGRRGAGTPTTTSD